MHATGIVFLHIPIRTLETPEIKNVGIYRPGQSWKRHRPWKTREKSWNSKVVILEIYYQHPL